MGVGRTQTHFSFLLPNHWARSSRSGQIRLTEFGKFGQFGADFNSISGMLGPNLASFRPLFGRNWPIFHDFHREWSDSDRLWPDFSNLSRLRPNSTLVRFRRTLVVSASFGLNWTKFDLISASAERSRLHCRPIVSPNLTKFGPYGPKWFGPRGQPLA